MSTDTKALNYKYTQVTDADMIILVRKVEDLQQKVVDMYYDYLTARKMYDMASEMVEFSKNNILAQAGQSMLAQANQSNQGVLSLLQG